MRERLKRLYSPWSIPGWLIIAWKVADMWDTMSFIFEQLSPFGKFLSSPLGTIVVLVIGFGILIYLVVKPEKKHVIPQTIIAPQEGSLSVKQQSLEQTLDEDKANIVSRIYNRDYIWELSGLTEPDPYIDLVFTVINAAVFAIKVESAKGRFLIEGHECAQEADLVGSTLIRHGVSGGIRIRQRLTRDMADLIIGRRDLIPTSKMDAARKGKVNISLKSCHLTISLEIEGEPPKTITRAAGEDHEVSVP